MTDLRYQPMLAANQTAAFTDSNWWFENKWDGIRALLYWDSEHLTIHSRSGVDLTSHYPELASFTAPAPLVLDGEIIAFDPDGKPSFGRLSQRMGKQGPAAVEISHQIPISYVVFDLLHWSNPLLDRPIEERWEQLSELDSPVIVRSEPTRTDGEELFEAVTEQGLEGIVAKRAGSVYQPGRRSTDWLKITSKLRVRVVIGGYTIGDGDRASTFGALLTGLWDGNGSLRWTGAVGSGFDQHALTKIRQALDMLAMERSPFDHGAELPKSSVWVKPVLVAMVEIKNWNTSGKMRSPVFLGITDDAPDTVNWENEGPGPS